MRRLRRWLAYRRCLAAELRGYGSHEISPPEWARIVQAARQAAGY